MTFDFFLTASTNTGPCHAFSTRDQFCGIEDVEYIQNLTTKPFKSQFFHVIVYKDPKGYKNKTKTYLN